MEGTGMKSELFYKNPKTILNKGTGFLAGYTHSLNPYTGCSFGCSYCYVRAMPVALFRDGEWGNWVDIKKGAANLLKKELQRAKAKGNVTIFMSSSTDPYQPIEHKEKVTRSLLEVMAADPPNFLLVQTRSPLVSRDIDLLQQFKEKVRVSVTIETDSETIRKHFTPDAPPIFPEKLKPFVDRICLDDYFLGDGSGGKRTRKLDMEEKYAQLGLEDWYGPHVINNVYNQFIKIFPESDVYLSQAGFEP